MTLSTLAELSKREEPATPEELSRLSLVLKRIEGTDKLRIERERAAAKAARAAPGAGQAPGQAPPRKGLSPETVDLIDEAVVGFRFRPRPPVTSAPVDPWNPSESHLIPANPARKMCRKRLLPFPSTAGASSARLPTRLSARRAIARSGPAARRSFEIAPPPKARGAPCHVMAGLARTGSGYPAIHRAAHPSRGMTEGDARIKSDGLDAPSRRHRNVPRLWL